MAALVRLACAGLLVWTGWIHLHLWLEGYRQLPTNGPLFLAAALGAFLLAAVLVVLPRPVIGLLGAGFLIATLGALIVSINFGLFGFTESAGASFVMLSLVIESIGTTPLPINTLQGGRRNRTTSNTFEIIWRRFAGTSSRRRPLCRPT